MATVYSEYSRDRAGNSKQDSEVISVANIQSQLQLFQNHWCW